MLSGGPWMVCCCYIQLAKYGIASHKEQVLPLTPHLVCRASLGSVVHPIPLGGLRPCLFSRIISSRLHNHAYSAPTVFHTRVRWEYSFTQVKAVLKHLASLKAHNSLDRFWYARRSNLLEWFWESRVLVMAGKKEMLSLLTYVLRYVCGICLLRVFITAG